MLDNSLGRYVFQFLLVFFPKVADQVLTEQVSFGFKMMEVVRMVILDEQISSQILWHNNNVIITCVHDVDDENYNDENDR